MKRKRVLTKRTSQVRRQRDPIPWKYCVLTVVCGLLLLGGFFAAAKQHFSAIGYAMDNAKLRMRISELKDEKRKLRLSKERASSPESITRLAKKIGFTDAPKMMIPNTPAESTKPVPASVDVPVYTYVTEPKRKSEPRPSVPRDPERERKPLPQKLEPENIADAAKDQIAALVQRVPVTSKR